MKNSRKLFSIELDVSDHDCNDGRYAQWANYGTIVAEGNTLEELLDDASIDTIDQDGGELNMGPADSNWMQDLIETEYNRIKLPRGVAG